MVAASLGIMLWSKQENGDRAVSFVPFYRQGNGVTENLLGDLCEVAGLARVELGI